MGLKPFDRGLTNATTAEYAEHAEGVHIPTHFGQ
jgi:hypothetical protein